MLQFFCIDMRKADCVFILCTVWPAARALPTVRIKARSVWWGLVSHLYNEKLQTSNFPDGWEACACQVLFPNTTCLPTWLLWYKLHSVDK